MTAEPRQASARTDTELAGSERRVTSSVARRRPSFARTKQLAAIILGMFFVLVAGIYYTGWHFQPSATDYTGFTLLLSLGSAMALAALILVRGSKS